MNYDLRHWFDNLWKWKCNLPEEEDVVVKLDSLEDLHKSEWSPEFEKLMRNRLIQGSMRYGKMGHGSIPKGKPRYDRCNSIRKRLKIYEDTGNLEMLVDIANFALLLFEERYHPNSHFKSIDDGEHDKIVSK
jgi:hypothetical protein